MWLGLTAVAARGGLPRLADLPGLLVLLVMAVVSFRLMDIPIRGAANSFTLVVLLTALVLYGPVAAGVLGLVVALADTKYGLSVVPAINGFMMGLMSLAGGLAYRLLGGSNPLTSTETSVPLIRHVGIPMLGADLVMCAVNVLVLAGMIGISGGSPRALIGGSVRELVPLFIAYAPIAFVFVLLWGPAQVGPASALLIAAPLAIARFVYVQYGDEVRAHQRILTMFLRAADDPDRRIASHAARVAELSQLIAAELGLGDTDRASLGYAAHLHDIGMKSVVRATDSMRGGSRPYSNVQALVPHPEVAAQIVADIDFLQGAAQAIRAHHERLDGRGYPDGLAGDEIPLLARVLAVADAFDALTTRRGDRPALGVEEALAELKLSVDSHLDPAVLDALRAGLRGRDWRPQDDPVSEGSWLWDHHTLPAMSDVIADEMAVAATSQAADAARLSEVARGPEHGGAGSVPRPRPPAAVAAVGSAVEDGPGARVPRARPGRPR